MGKNTDKEDTRCKECGNLVLQYDDEYLCLKCDCTRILKKAKEFLDRQRSKNNEAKI